MLAAHALDRHKAVCQGLAVLAVSGHLVLEGAVQDLLPIEAQGNKTEQKNAVCAEESLQYAPNSE